MEDYYQILDVKQTATKEEIEEAYRKQAYIYHPDTLKGKPRNVVEYGQERMKKINAAGEVLRDGLKRQRYDTEWKRFFSHHNATYQQPQDERRSSIGFTFKSGEIANTLDELIPLSDEYWNEAKGYLYRGQFEKWFEQLYRYDVLEKIKTCNVEPQQDVGLEKFLHCLKPNLLYPSVQISLDKNAIHHYDFSDGNDYHIANITIQNFGRGCCFGTIELNNVSWFNVAREFSVVAGQSVVVPIEINPSQLNWGKQYKGVFTIKSNSTNHPKTQFIISLSTSSFWSNREAMANILGFSRAKSSYFSNKLLLMITWMIAWYLGLEVAFNSPLLSILANSNFSTAAAPLWIKQWIFGLMTWCLFFATLISEIVDDDHEWERVSDFDKPEIAPKFMFLFRMAKKSIMAVIMTSCLFSLAYALTTFITIDNHNIDIFFVALFILSSVILSGLVLLVWTVSFTIAHMTLWLVFNRFYPHQSKTLT